MCEHKDIEDGEEDDYDSGTDAMPLSQRATVITHIVWAKYGLLIRKIPVDVKNHIDKNIFSQNLKVKEEKVALLF